MQPQTDVVLFAVEWQPRALIRAQLIEEGLEVVATNTWPMMRRQLRPGTEPRVALVDLKGLPDPRQILKDLHMLIEPERVIVLTAAGTVPRPEIEHLGFHALARPIVLDDIVKFIKFTMAVADAARLNGRMTMGVQVSSPAFADGSQIPKKYTCDGQDVAPPLEWSGVPQRARSLAVICEDPDAPSGTFTHWVLYDIPASTPLLGERTSIGKSGLNDFGRMGFGGPCPPKKDGAHHYHFHVYALDLESLGPAGMSKDDVRRAMSGHVLAEGEVTGTYRRASA